MPSLIASDFVKDLLTANLTQLFGMPKFRSFLYKEAKPRRAFVIKLELKCECFAYFLYQFKTSPARMKQGKENKLSVEYFVPTGASCHIDFLPPEYKGYPQYRLQKVPFSHTELHTAVMKRKEEFARGVGVN